MPEGHKTHYIARQHDRLLAGHPLKVTSPQGRFRADGRKVSGHVLDRVEAVGKHLFYHFDGNQIVHVHLGRYGKYRQHAVPPPAPVGQVRMRMVGTNVALDLNGPTTCRVIDEEIRDEVVARLGPDPLAGGPKQDLWRNIHHSRKPIGALLLDQSILAGVGNIFRAEVLYEIEMNPSLRGCDLDRQSFDRLWRSLTKMMKTGLKHGRIIAVTAREAGMPLNRIDGTDRFRVYKKQECRRCHSAIETVEMASRKLYLCPTCQIDN
ncbi:MAG: Fpg/Nei family DNA glycosylase [Pirellulaceae bacterium]|nr:Fpg/Nei family DNA glycosylase [Pirellulaceae bacterium]